MPVITIKDIHGLSDAYLRGRDGATLAIKNKVAWKDCEWPRLPAVCLFQLYNVPYPLN